MQFEPPVGLRNRHIQTIFSSIGPRRTIVRRKFKPFISRSQAMVLNCHDGIRLAGVLNQANDTPAKKLVVLIHGWEGSIDSLYMLSMSAKLLEAGIDVFRLNLRDHGDTHHLNKEIFNSTLVEEVMTGLEDLQTRLNYPDYALGGFSLGGNFALRIAALAHDKAIVLSQVIAFCPAIHAKASNAVLNQRKNYIYGQYFVRKWKRSLYKKLEHYPEYQYGSSLPSMTTLDQMNESLVPKYTEFDNVDSYFDAYAITGDVMSKTICPCYLHFSKDDMIIPYQDIELLTDNPQLDITVTERGGHCGFIMNWKFDSWQDERVLELVIN